MTTTKISELTAFFKENPWGKIPDDAVYPKGSMLLNGDMRFWGAKNELKELIFYVQDSAPDISSLNIPSLYGVKVELIENSKDGAILKLTLLENALSDKFFIVIKHLLYKVYELSGRSLFQRSLQTLGEWSNFLKPTKNGVSTSVLVGFWGEVFILNQYFVSVFDTNTAVKSWIGPEGKKQDFSIDNKSFEVKTTLSGDSSSITITSLDQLDKISSDLYLVFLRIDRASEGGISVQDLIDNVLSVGDELTNVCFLNKVNQIIGDASNEQLKEKFMLGGIFLYQVRDEFPCITNVNTLDGIASASYQISLSSIEGYLMDIDMLEVLGNE